MSKLVCPRCKTEPPIWQKLQPPSDDFDGDRYLCRCCGIIVTVSMTRKRMEMHGGVHMSEREAAWCDLLEYVGIALGDTAAEAHVHCPDAGSFTGCSHSHCRLAARAWERVHEVLAAQRKRCPHGEPTVAGCQRCGLAVEESAPKCRLNGEWPHAPDCQCAEVQG